jgi:hypothetical protein
VDIVARSLHEIGLAVWFGGSLMGATAVPAGAAAAPDPETRLSVEERVWTTWRPLQAAGIVMHLAGAVALTVANRRRIAGQRGVASVAVAKGAVTTAALGATVAAAALGRRAGEDRLDARSKRPALAAAQWAVAALTGAMLALDAVLGEQQRPVPVARGVVGRLLRRG